MDELTLRALQKFVRAVDGYVYVTEFITNSSSAKELREACEMLDTTLTEEIDKKAKIRKSIRVK